MPRKHIVSIHVGEKARFLLSKAQLDRAEAAYKHLLSPAVRNEIRRTTAFFIRYAGIGAPIKQRDLNQKLDQLNSLARSLQKDFGVKPKRRSVKRPADILRRYFHDATLSVSPVRTNTDSGRQELLLHTLDTLLTVCDCAKDQSGAVLQIEWDSWVFALNFIAKKNDLPFRVSKDWRRRSKEPSAFVLLVKALQAELPEKYRRQVNSDDALAGAIVRARKSVKWVDSSSSRPLPCSESPK